MNREDLIQLVMDALESLGGKGSIVQICQYIWQKKEHELRESGDLFYTWQYDMRWAGQKLRNDGVLIRSQEAPKGIWIIAK